MPKTIIFEHPVNRCLAGTKHNVGARGETGGDVGRSDAAHAGAVPAQAAARRAAPAPAQPAASQPPTGVY